VQSKLRASHLLEGALPLEPFHQLYCRYVEKLKIAQTFDCDLGFANEKHLVRLELETLASYPKVAATDS
jgi:hypothetical protein